MEEERKRTEWHRWMVVGMFLLVTYPLSIGPVGWFMEALGINEFDHWVAKLLRKFYAPVLILGQLSPQIDEVLSQYLHLWMKRP